MDTKHTFAEVTELDIVVAYGQTWRNMHARELALVAARPNSRVRVFLADPDDELTVAVLADRFDITRDELRSRITATRSAYETLRRPSGAQIEVYYRPGDRVFSFYRFDDVAILGLYSHSRTRGAAVPVFVCARPGELYEFIQDETHRHPRPEQAHMIFLHAADDASRPTTPTRQLGATGITVPAIGIGCWAIGGLDDNLGMPMGWSTGADEDQSFAGLEKAWKCGARLYDTADVYGHGKSERLLGRLVAQVPRNEIVLASKVGYFAGTAEHGFEPRHMRRQLEQSLDNLQTDHLDIYAFHHPNFGKDDCWLQPAIEAMRTFRDQGLIKAIGMRGPHRFALDRLATPPDQRGDKIARFQALFHKVGPDVLAIRDNLLTPSGRSDGIFSFASQYNVGVLISKPLGQGLLTGTYRPDVQPSFGAGDHRLRKRWFQPDAIETINTGLNHLRAIVGPRTEDLISVALWACLDRSLNAVVLVGFTSPGQVAINLRSLTHARPPIRLPLHGRSWPKFRRGSMPREKLSCRASL